jgi:hypothetical protein
MAARYFVGGGTGNWNSTTNWSDTDGGASGFSFPIAGDTVFLTAASGANTLTINTGSICTSIDCTGFTGTLAGSATLTVAGNVTFDASMTITSTGTLTISTTSTVTSNGKTWTGNLTTPSTSSTLTLADDLTINGLVTFPSVAGLATIINGNILYVSGGLTHGNINSISGTTKFIFNGTGTWQSNNSSVISNDIEINTLGTITFGAQISVSGSFKYITGTIVVGTSTLRLNGSPILDASGINFYNLFSNSATITLTSDLNVTNNYTTNAVTTINGSTLYLGGLTIQNNVQISGTTNLIFNGTGTWSATSVGQLRLNTTINTAGTLTISGVVYYNTGTLTYTSGTIDATGSTLTVANQAAGTTTFATNGMIWNNIIFVTTSSFIVLSNNLSASGTVTINSSMAFNGNTMNIGGLNVNNIAVTGTTNFVFNGTGTWTTQASTTFTPNITINTAGTITLASIVRYTGGTLTYTAGTVDATTNNSTLTLTSSTTLNTAGVTWNNITFTGTSTITINSLLSVNGTMTLPGANLTFAGTSGWSVNTLVHNLNISTRNHTLVSTLTYTITNNFTIIATNAARITFRSSIGGSQAILTLNAAATQDLKFVNATDIDSSLGQTINSNKGTLNNATNWYRTNGTFMYLLQQ